MTTTFHTQSSRPTTALLMAGLILVHGALPAAGAENKEKSEADYDLQAVAPMIGQMQRHLKDASEAVERNDGKAARDAFTRADRVFTLTRDFLQGADAARDDARAPQVGRRPGGRLAPNRAPGWGRFWPDAFDDDDFFGGGFFDRRDPFMALREMQEQMDRMMDESDWMRADPQAFRGRALSPRMDLTESDDAYVVRLDMPGLDKSDINVKVEGLLLTIGGSSESDSESQDADGKTLRRERRSGRFQRTVSLPGPVQADKVDAHYENGVLTITVPKAAGLPADPHTVPIR
ncbi:MAG: Hsp20/alpha crystallin family protein [Kiritimatiellia bacterium]|jgi:HSP20 family protein